MTDQTSAHDMLARLRARRAHSSQDATLLRDADPEPLSRAGAIHAWRATCAAMLALQASRRRHLRLRQQHPAAGARSGRGASRSAFRASCRPTFDRSSAAERARFAGWRSRATRKTSTAPIDLVLELFPHDESLSALDSPGTGANPVSGTAGPHLLARVRRARQVRPGI